MKRYLLLSFIFTAVSTFAQKTTEVPAPPPVAPTNIASVAYPNAPVIEFESTVHDFGTVKKGSPMVYKFKYKNTGKEPLILYNCKPGCGCTTTKCSKEPLKSGKSGYIEVHYDSMRVGKFAKEVIVSSNARNGVLSIVIKGNIEGEEEGSDPAPAIQKEEPVVAPDVKHNE